MQIVKRVTKGKRVFWEERRRRPASQVDIFNIIQKRPTTLPIHSGHQVRSTYQPGSHRRKGHTGFLIHLLSAVRRALIFLARRIQPLLSLVDREVEFCVLTI